MPRAAVTVTIRTAITSAPVGPRSRHTRTLKGMEMAQDFVDTVESTGGVAALANDNYRLCHSDEPEAAQILGNAYVAVVQFLKNAGQRATSPAVHCDAVGGVRLSLGYFDANHDVEDGDDDYYDDDYSSEDDDDDDSGYW